MNDRDDLPEKLARPPQFHSVDIMALIYNDIITIPELKKSCLSKFSPPGIFCLDIDGIVSVWSLNAEKV